MTRKSNNAVKKFVFCEWIRLNYLFKAQGSNIDLLLSTIIDEGKTLVRELSTTESDFLKYLLVLTCFMIPFVLLIARCLHLNEVRNSQKLIGYTDIELLTVLCDHAKIAFTAERGDKVINSVEKNNVDVNTPLLHNGLTLFLSSCLSANKRLISYMLSIGGDIKSTTVDGDSCLYLATFAVLNYGLADYSVLEDIIQAGCDVNMPTTTGYIPLHRAAASGNVEVIKLLLKYGSNRYKATLQGILPVDIAINNGHLEAAQLLRISVYNPHVWDVIDPHTPPHIKMGLQSPKKHHLVESSRKFCSPKIRP